MASAEAKLFAAYGRALSDSRDKAYFQVHFGADDSISPLSRRRRRNIRDESFQRRAASG